MTDEELTTILTKIEDMMYSRPLTTQSADSRDMIVLRPNDFIRIRGELRDIDHEIQVSQNVKIRSRWRRIQEVSRQFWRRWMKELVADWRSRKKMVRDRRES